MVTYIGPIIILRCWHHDYRLSIFHVGKEQERGCRVSVVGLTRMYVVYSLRSTSTVYSELLSLLSSLKLTLGLPLENFILWVCQFVSAATTEHWVWSPDLCIRKSSHSCRWRCLQLTRTPETVVIRILIQSRIPWPWSRRLNVSFWKRISFFRHLLRVWLLKRAKVFHHHHACEGITTCIR